MCGRIATTLPNDAMAQLFAARPANSLPMVPNYNVCPTDQLSVVMGGGPNTPGRELVSMRWGFLPHWYKSFSDGPLLINARAETIAEKPAFRAACRMRRCLVPVSGYYEWTKDETGARLPWYISPQAREMPLVLAGIWQDWELDDLRVRSCAIVTTQANSDTAEIHHRMPVVIQPQDWDLWLGNAGKGAARLMRPAPENELVAWRVGRAVNSNRAEGAELIDPLDTRDY